MTESKEITLSRTLMTTVASVVVMCLFCGAGLVASFVVDHGGGDGAPYLEFAGRWVTWIGAVTGGGIVGHAGRHFGRNTPSGVDP